MMLTVLQVTPYILKWENGSNRMFQMNTQTDQVMDTTKLMQLFPASLYNTVTQYIMSVVAQFT